jgi:sulfur-carrier protein
MTTTDMTADTAPDHAAPHVTVRLFAGAAATFGADTAAVRASSLQQVVDALLEGASAEAARVIDRSSYLVNAVACTDRTRSLADGDRVDVLPPFAGG